jgi:hypothetical protein
MAIRLQNLALFVVIALLTVNLFMNRQSSAKAAGAVQYKIVPVQEMTVNQKQMQDILTQQGAEGWELINHYGTQGADLLIFKK